MYQAAPTDLVRGPLWTESEGLHETFYSIYYQLPDKASCHLLANRSSRQPHRARKVLKTRDLLLACPEGCPHHFGLRGFSGLYPLLSTRATKVVTKQAQSNVNIHGPTPLEEVAMLLEAVIHMALLRRLRSCHTICTNAISQVACSVATPCVCSQISVGQSSSNGG